ncbi:MAG: tRNA (N6-threonylcarbamoyladenosine(37)-N6)-methyltransferase TrmO, partial [Pseudomonadota bacterium]|nr:tRNA (N6-threonylcarbamoyladenosine(37)-N6)-methyltransferase TrmO [Pseudomonadota bacterium]
IKPYLPYADSLEEAAAGFAPEAPGNPCDIIFSNAAAAALNEQKHPQIKRLITEVLQQQPEPAYHRQQEGEAEAQRRIYGISLYNLNIRWRYIHSASPPAIEVIAIE